MMDPKWALIANQPGKRRISVPHAVRCRHAPRKEAMVTQKTPPRIPTRYKAIGEPGAMANAAWASAVCLSTSSCRRISLCMQLFR